MELQDDRTQQQKESHNVIVVGTDTFMSGWGKAGSGKSYAGWACKPQHLPFVQKWVESRSDMKRVRVVDGNYRPSGDGHCHIYVADEGHPALIAK